MPHRSENHPSGFDALAFERLIAELSAKFVEARTEEIDDCIEGALQAVVEALGLDRSTLTRFSERDHALVATHSWARPGIEDATGIALADSVPGVRRLLAGEGFEFSDPEELPEELGVTETFRSIGVQSHVTLPLAVGARVLGGFHVASLHQTIDWSPVRSRLELLARIFASALDRSESDGRLRRALVEVETLKNRLERENLYLREQLQTGGGADRLIGNSPSFQRVLRAVAQVGPTESPVLLLGETGTGKDLLARRLHQISPRKDRPFVAIDCTLLPPTLIESELFGHERGAFSGAHRTKPGRFETADTGTLFLDEIGELPLDLQAKLLRALESGEISRLGSTRTRTVDVRVLVATNRELQAEVARGAFRKDLYYRVSVFPVSLPPLRERREDIPLLVWHFTELLQSGLGRRIHEIPADAMEALRRHDWPGNIRELRNVIERSLILTQGSVLEVDLPGMHRDRESTAGDAVRLEAVEREHIRRVLEGCGGRIKGPGGAAERLGLKPSTLYYRLKRLGLRRA